MAGPENRPTEGTGQRDGNVRNAIPAPPAAPNTHEGDQCDYCRMPIPGTPIVATDTDARYHFCTHTCHDRLLDGEEMSAQYHGFRRIDPGIDGLDRDLPQGIPRNSFVLLSGHAGTREATLGTEFIWRRLQRGEPAGIVTFTEPPISIIQRFLDMHWNVQPALEADQLRIVDCFTSRMNDPAKFHRHLNDWNRHLQSIVDDHVERVNDPSDTAEIKNKIDNVVEELDMIDRGALYVDSLVEFGSLVQPVRAYDFIKDLRADICKGRFVPIFGGATRQPTEDEPFPHDLSYVLDGIIELELSPNVVEDTLIRRIRVRKMSGVLAITEWKAFEFTAGRGLFPFDPKKEMASNDHQGQPDGPPDGHSY